MVIPVNVLLFLSQCHKSPIYHCVEQRLIIFYSMLFYCKVSQNMNNNDNNNNKSLFIFFSVEHIEKTIILKQCLPLLILIIEIIIIIMSIVKCLRNPLHRV